MVDGSWIQKKKLNVGARKGGFPRLHARAADLATNGLCRRAQKRPEELAHFFAPKTEFGPFW